MFEKIEKDYIPLCWSLDPKEDNLIDREVDVFYPFLSITNLPSHKSNLLEGFELGKVIFIYTS